MKTILIVLSSVLIVGSLMPYLRDIVRGKTKPRIVSWFTWMVLTAITGAAALSDHSYPTAIMMLIDVFCTAAVVILGWRLGDKKFVPLDIVCQLGALVGLLLWFKTDSPAAAVITTTVIDAIGTVPTLVHSWQKPYEETWVTFAFSAVAAVLTLIVSNNWHVTSSLPPVYLFLVNAVLTLVIVLRYKHAVPDKSPAHIVA